jgi:hypothetical protein
MANAKTIELKDDANLGIAMLIAEFADGSYQPVAPVVSINEAREIAASDMRARTNELEHGGEPACPRATSYGRRNRMAATARFARSSHSPQTPPFPPAPARHRRACGSEVRTLHKRS